MWFPIDDSGWAHGSSISVYTGDGDPVDGDGADFAVWSHLQNLVSLTQSGGPTIPRRRRVRSGAPGVPAVLVVDEREEGADSDEDLRVAEAASVALATINSMMGDDRTVAALDGLRNVASVPLGTFVQRVHGNSEARRQHL